MATVFSCHFKPYTAARRGQVSSNVRVRMVPRDGQISRWGNPGPEKLSDLTKVTRCIRGQSAGVAWQQPQLSLRIPNLSLSPGPPPSGKGFTFALSTNSLTRGCHRGRGHPDSRAGSTCACAHVPSPFPFPLFFLPPHSLPA